jgi:signal transduction histidine kinase/CHASE2 domain-containing sensor protein
VKTNLANIASLAAITALAALLGLSVSWWAPGIDQYFRDRMTRLHGPTPPPDDIAIVAIDEPSIARFGRFPWPRSFSARAVDAIAAAQPKAIALDVLYADRTSQSEDNALVHSIQQAGDVIVAAQLVSSAPSSGIASWLMPLPEIEHAAAAVGHVNVSIGSDGIAHQVLLQMADNQGQPIWAMALDAIGVAEGISQQSIVSMSKELILGSHTIPSEASAPNIVIGAAKGAMQTLPAWRMNIDYIGPAGSYKKYSFADVADGRVPSSQFRGKYVLVGATAPSLGDRLASPFMHSAGLDPDQQGSLMPGVEVLANTLNTILRARYYREPPSWIAILFGAFVAVVTLSGLSAAGQGPFAALQQIGALAAIVAAIVVGSYFAFTYLLLFTPLTLCLVSCGSAGMLGEFRRSVVASKQLDRAIEDLRRADYSLSFTSPGSAAESILRLADVSGVAIYIVGRCGGLQMVSVAGTPILRKGHSGFAERMDQRLLPIHIKRPDRPIMLVMAYCDESPSPEIQKLCATIAVLGVEEWASRARLFRSWWPRGLNWKAQALRNLNTEILDRARFVDLSLRSVDDTLLIAGIDGRITFANRRAAAVLQMPEQALLGRDLLDVLGRAAQISSELSRESLTRLVMERVTMELEITIRGARPRHFILRIAPVCSGEDQAAPVLGIVASLSDITRQHELQQTKNDVMALVSHEMRTPLTAIQGMSELLAQFDFDPERGREMGVAIHDEAKRLTRMINQYLDITRLESGATTLHRVPLRLEAVVERTLLMLEPLAAYRAIRLTRQITSDIAPVIADADLFASAVSNLVSNAIKYSPRNTEIVVSVANVTNGVCIEVADQGYGIAEDSLSRVFEKFYRVPRVEDVDIPGTGLGLALVREIAELHGGSVSVRSSVGVGSVFTLWIPRAEGQS